MLRACNNFIVRIESAASDRSSLPDLFWNIMILQLKSIYIARSQKCETYLVSGVTALVGGVTCFVIHDTISTHPVTFWDSLYTWSNALYMINQRAGVTTQKISIFITHFTKVIVLISPICTWSATFSRASSLRSGTTITTCTTAPNSITGRSQFELLSGMVRQQIHLDTKSGGSFYKTNAYQESKQNNDHSVITDVCDTKTPLVPFIRFSTSAVSGTLPSPVAWIQSSNTAKALFFAVDDKEVDQ